MSSPDRMEMLAMAIENLVQAMRLMDAEQQSRDERIRTYDERMRTYEAYLREVDVQSRENRAHISEIVGLLTERQLDIVRLDAAS